MRSSLYPKFPRSFHSYIIHKAARAPARPKIFLWKRSALLFYGSRRRLRFCRLRLQAFVLFTQAPSTPAKRSLWRIRKEATSSHLLNLDATFTTAAIEPTAHPAIANDVPSLRTPDVTMFSFANSGAGLGPDKGKRLRRRLELIKASQ